MNQIQLNLEIDPANTKVAEALANLILVMGGATVQPKLQQSNPISTRQGKETFADTSETDDQKLTLEQDQKFAEGILKAQTAKEESTKEIATVDGPTLEEVRKELGVKVTEHREKIKAKLTELGAKNVTVLNPTHYATFNTFLKAL